MPKKGLSGKVKKAKEETAKDMRSIHARIQQRAYLLYLDRQQTGRTGDHLSDWLSAERQIAPDLTAPSILH